MRTPLRKIKDPVERALERDLRALEREQATFNKLAKEYDIRIREQEKTKRIRFQRGFVPSYLLYAPKKKWANIIASGISMSFLIQCCERGCCNCHFIGWKRAKPGTIVDIGAEYFSTKEIAQIKCISYKTVGRMCDRGEIKFFKVPDSNFRYIIL